MFYYLPWILCFYPMWMASASLELMAQPTKEPRHDQE